MFRWFKRSQSARRDQSQGSAAQTKNTSRRLQQPRTLAAELDNKQLERPVLFEPALKQYSSAFRAGEPVFKDAEQGARWFQLRSRVLQHVLLRICNSMANEHLILRGSALMSIWFGREARPPGDLDWVITPENWSYESELAKELVRNIEECMKGTTDETNAEFFIPDRSFACDDIWMYEKAPGKRLIVPWQCEDTAMNGTVQLDLVFEEVMPSPPELVNVGGADGPTMQVAAATREQSLAWKLLWLETDSYGQGKDLYDAVLLAENSALHPEVLRETFRAGGDVNIYYSESLRRFDADAIRNWHIEWDDFKTEYPSVSGGEQEWKERLIAALGPLFSKLGTQT